LIYQIKAHELRVHGFFSLYGNGSMYRSLIALWLVMGASSIALAQDPTVAPLMRLLSSGRLPKERHPQVLEMVCKRGGPDELRFVFEQTLAADKLTPALRVQTLNWLADASVTRKVKPAGDLSGLEQLVKLDANAKNADLTLAAMKLAATWQVAEAADELSSLATDPQANDKLRRTAIEGLATLGTNEAREVLGQLATSAGPTKVRILATAGLASIDVNAAAQAAASVLSAASPTDDPDPMLNAFFLLKEGSGKLTAALKSAQLKPDVAKRSLRYMYSVGHNDPELSNLLSEMAGIAADVPPATQEEAFAIAAEVAARGDAARGEQIFRRAEVSCINCHAIHRAGGQVGPDLSNVGRISPVDYIVTSILNPNLAIKEAYVTRIIATTDGKLVQGIAIDRDDVRVILRTADGKTLTIPTADIEEEDEGRSLMPQGLTKFLTQQEFYDLAKFVSELGKEGSGYTASSPPAIQRWRVLAEPNPELLAEVPNVEQVREYLLDTPADDWRPAYAMVSGQLPLNELQPADAARPLYLMGEVDVTVDGEVTFNVDSTEPVEGWIDALPFDAQKPFTAKLTAGRHKLILRVATPQQEQPRLRVSVSRPEESSAQFDLVAGQ
jgi:putative heme-binding domain-containing protein